MNLNQAQLLANIAKDIKGVPVVDFTRAPIVAKNGGNGCFWHNAIQFGHVEYDDDRYMGVEDAFNQAERQFGITRQEAEFIVYLNGNGQSSGEQHYQVCKEILTKYGYAHLLEERNWARELMANLPEELIEA